MLLLDVWKWALRQVNHRYLSLVEMAKEFRYIENWQRAGIPFIAGVIHSNDLDYDVAKALAAEVISEEPFEAVTEEHLEKAEKMMDDCAEVICCVDKFGTMNAANRRLVEKAKRDGKLKTE